MVTMVWVVSRQTSGPILVRHLHIHITTHITPRLMGAPTSEVGYTIATTRRENHEVHKNRWWHWGGLCVEMWQHVHTIYDDVILQKYNFSQALYKLPDDGRSRNM